MSNNTETKPLPAYRIHSVSKDGSGNTVWAEIGSAWPNKDGKGLNLYFKARPLEGANLVLRVPVVNAEAAAETTKRKKAA